MSRPVNLAREPFRNERLPTLLLAAGILVLAGVTFRQALVARDLLPGRSGNVEGEVMALEAEAARLRAESAELERVPVPPDAPKEWATLKGLVDLRAFSWTGLLSALEAAVPPGVRLVSVSARDPGRGTELEIRAVGRGNEDALALLQALQQSGAFEGAFLESWNEAREGVDISCSVRYVPAAAEGGGQ